MVDSTPANHKVFLTRLQKSVHGVLLVARHLILGGSSIYIPGLQQAPTPEQSAQYSDEGDLYVIKGRNKDRIEVKQKNIKFTTYEDFPYNTIFVCSRSSWDPIEPKPTTFVIVNQAGTHIALIGGGTSRHWKLKYMQDPDYSGSAQCQAFYECPLEYVRFMPLRGTTLQF